MKKLATVLTTIAIVIAINVKAQEKWNFSNLSIQTGETPLTCGITIGTTFEKGKSKLVADFNADLGEVMYFYAPKEWVSFGPSVGFFNNTPWLGPIVSFSLFKGHLTTLNWIGWCFGDPNTKKTSAEAKFMFSYQQASLVFGGFESYYVFQHYLKNYPEHIAGVKQTFNLNEKMNLSGGVGYMSRADKVLWSLGMSYKF